MSYHHHKFPELDLHRLSHSDMVKDLDAFVVAHSKQGRVRVITGNSQKAYDLVVNYLNKYGVDNIDFGYPEKPYLEFVI